MSETTKPDAEPVGIRCPRCGCRDLRIRHTLRREGSIVQRYRVCRHCGRVVTTIEQPIGPASRKRK